MSKVTTLPMPKDEGPALQHTRSKELIEMMSKFGYSISYGDSQIYIDTFFPSSRSADFTKWDFCTTEPCTREISSLCFRYA